MFHFTPLLDPQSASSSSLLQLDDGLSILIDIGCQWNDDEDDDEAFSAESLQIIAQHVPSISFILLTHPTLEHLGAYSHCCKHVPDFARIPVFATTPVIHLGRTLIADLYASHPPAASTVALGGAKVLCDPPTTAEITSHFNRIHPLKYSQPHQPLLPAHAQPSWGNLTITAYGAGHTPGGTIWHLQHGLESIVYASDWNQGRENLLSGAAWLGGGAGGGAGGGGGGGADIIEPLRRPTALVCSSRGVEKTETLSRKKRDEVLIGLIRETIARGGKVLIPTDSSARVLELAFLLNETWRENLQGPHAETYRHARIYMASTTSSSTVRQLQGMVEWLDETIVRDAETAMGNHAADARKVPTLLDWTHIKPIERKSQLERALRRRNPSIILASDASLEWGSSRRALEVLAGDARNLVVLTESIATSPDLPSSTSTSSTVAKQLAECWRNRTTSTSSTARVAGDAAQTVSLKHYDMASLSLEENLLYQQYLARQRALDTTLPGVDNSALLLPAEEGLEAEESSDDESEDENEGDHQGRALNLSAAILTQQGTRRRGGRLTDAELGVNILLQKRGVHDFDVRGKRGRERMFPFLKSRTKADEFGEIVLAEQFLRAEEKEDEKVSPPVQQQSQRQQPQQQQGEKRKWGGEAEKDGKKMKREQKKREPDDIDALIARATGTGQGGVNGDAGAISTPRNGADGEEEEEDNHDDDDDDDDTEDDDSESDYDPEHSTGGPRKLIPKPNTTLQITCRLAALDFTAIHDFRDLQMLIPLIAPRKLILIQGTSRETGILADACRILGEQSGESSSSSSNNSVLTPRQGERVDCGVDTNAWECRLGRGLLAKLKWQAVKGLGVVAISGWLLPAAPAPADVGADGGEEPEMKKVKVKTSLDVVSADGEEKEEKSSPSAITTTTTTNTTTVSTIPTLDLLPTSYHHYWGSSTTTTTTTTTTNSKTRKPQQQQQQQRRAATTTAAATTTEPVHVGDLKLTDLRKLIQEKGLSAVFSGEGTLVVDGCVIVRKGRGRGGGGGASSGSGGSGREGVVELEVVGGGGRAWEVVRGVVRGGLAVVEGV